MAIASCISYSPWLANAASLGKLTVLSGLGQPLRAELELGAAADELGGMTARLAPVDAFKQAGVDYVSALSDLRFVIDKRSGGQSVVKVTSSKPVNEAFLDFLVELNWPTGRLVREYTFLLDPPELGAEKQVVRSVVDARVVDSVRSAPVSSPRPASVARSAPASRSTPPEKPEPAAKKQESQEGAHVVQRGETLRKIAAENQYDGVSLEQMLVGLFRSNPDAFVGKNINRLKAGAILNVPDKATVESVSQGEARRIAVSHAGDWGAYRQKLAAATAKGAAKEEGDATQAATGKITARVDEKAAPQAKSKDQVKVARSEGGKAADGAAVEDKLARDKALKEAQERVVALEKNVNDLQKLLEVKNQKLSELQQAPARKEEPKPVEPPKQEPSKPVEAKPAEPKAQDVAKPSDDAKASEPAKPVDVAPVAPQPAPPAAQPPAPPKKPAPPPPPPPPEPELLDTLLEDPLPLAAGGGVLALLAGGLVYMRRRRQQSAFQETTATPMSSSLGPNSVFRMTGGQSVDTGNTPPQTGDFSQTGPGTIDTDEVDPVAEADVYMAYGRDTQAEEILLEALQKDPQRTAIHAKLLEIYANRGSLKQFETLASELYAQTGGVGQDWAKVAALGARLDPRNPLYSGEALSGAAEPALNTVFQDMAPVVPVQEPVSSFAAIDTLAEVAPEQEPVDAMTLDFDIEPPPVDIPEVPAGGGHVDTSFEDANVLDFDLGTDVPVVASAASEPVLSLELPPAAETDALDFDLGEVTDVPKAAEPDLDGMPVFSQEDTLVVPVLTPSAEHDDGLASASLEQATAAALDFDFELPESAAPAAASAAPLADLGLDLSPSNDIDHTATVINMAPAPVDDDLEFDVSLGDSVFMGQPMPSPEFDIGSIDLDLSVPTAATAEAVPQAAVPVAAAETVRDERWEDVNTKLDLAKAYEEMGDAEGARELLNEVIAEGVPDLAEQAKAMLGRFNA